LLGWGRHAKVLEPRSLRTRLVAEAQAVADQYESSPTLLDG
jgi:predicted DNA-binding transcriptional regulator YafY